MHSFWIPALASGKRDLISNHTNYLWFTPDSSLRVQRVLRRILRRVARQHAIPRVHGDAAGIRVVGGALEERPDVRGGASAGRFGRPSAPTPRSAAPTKQDGQRAATGPGRHAGHSRWLHAPIRAIMLPARPDSGDAGPRGAELLHVQGDAARGAALLQARAVHRLPHRHRHLAPGSIGPTSRTSAAARRSPPVSIRTTPSTSSLWIKNAPAMKPGSLMPTLGKSAIQVAAPAATTISRSPTSSPTSSS